MGTQDDLTMRIEASAACGRRNNVAACVFIAIGVFASAATTISVATGGLTPAINATLATVPGIVVMVLRAFKFEQRSKWWWKKYHRLLKIQADQKPDGSNAADIKRRVADFLDEHYKEWPGFEFDKPPL